MVGIKYDVCSNHYQKSGSWLFPTDQIYISSLFSLQEIVQLGRSMTHFRLSQSLSQDSTQHCLHALLTALPSSAIQRPRPLHLVTMSSSIPLYHPSQPPHQSNRGRNLQPPLIVPSTPLSNPPPLLFTEPVVSMATLSTARCILQSASLPTPSPHCLWAINTPDGRQLL